MQFELQNFLPYRLSLLTNTVSQGIAGSYRESFDISITEWRILAVLGRYPGLTASEVVNKTAMDKVAISRGVKSLMSRKLLKRRTDPNDRRRRRYDLLFDFVNASALFAALFFENEAVILRDLRSNIGLDCLVDVGEDVVLHQLCDELMRF